MPEGVDATSFEFYEGIRIFVPGALAVAVADGVVRTVSADGNGLSLGAVQGIVAALALGLVFYFVDAPSKAAVMTPLQPTGHLRGWKLKPKQDTTLLNNYFVMLDVMIPSGIKARALYMGSMFRIGFEMIYLLGLSSTAMLSAATWTSDRLDPRVRYVASPGWLLMAAVLVIYVVALRRDVAADRRRQAHPAPTDMESQNFHFPDAIACVFAMLGTSAGLILGYRFQLPSWTLSVPTVAIAGLWMYRYFKGYPVELEPGATPPARRSPIGVARAMVSSVGLVKPAQPQRPAVRRRPAGAAQATLLLGAAMLCAVCSLMAQPLATYRLNEGELRTWCVVAALTLVLIAARGHEKRLKGAYATQNTWLTLNREEVSEKYFKPPEVTGAAGVPDTPGT